MKVLFTLLSIDAGSQMYLEASKALIKELIQNTPHDVLLTTNRPEYFDDLKTNRLFIRNNITENLIFKFNYEFNYNLKFLSFKDIPKGYDVIFYIDGDIKNNFWTDSSNQFLSSLVSEYNLIGSRMDCVLQNEVYQYQSTGHALFKHKILSYDILSIPQEDDIYNSQLPSEHYLIFKYDEIKMAMFAQKWEELNFIMQSKNGGNGVWGDGFEIGISARYAGYTNIKDLNCGDLESEFGFIFNGNKK